MTIKQLLCFHKPTTIGVARKGEYDYLGDKTYNVLICDKCGKVIKQRIGSIQNGLEKRIPTIIELLKSYYK